MNSRIKTYCHISTELACLSDRQLIDLLDKAESMHSGIGGTSVLLTHDETNIFVKKIPLTDLERKPENIMSTGNLFDLPLYCQYGVGSAGFGAWRELVSHIMTTNWVLAGECPNFPMLYHWRILPTIQPVCLSTEQEEALERDVQYWENSSAVRRRLEEKHHASASILLFLEYFPMNLRQWLSSEITAGGDAAESAVLLVDQGLKTTNDFINARGLLHMDAHFENIVTEGKEIYFSDFGLSLSTKFDLSNEEIRFFNTHLTYDQCSTVTNLLHCIITTMFGKDRWEIRLREYLDYRLDELPPYLDSLIRKYGQIALTMDKFYQKLQKESKSTPYPKAELDKLLAAITYKKQLSTH